MKSPESGLWFPGMETEGNWEGCADRGRYGVSLIRGIVMPLGLSFVYNILS